jgi:hypothetical protein
MGRGEFERYGPASPQHRPSEVPNKIPTWAWERLKLSLPITTEPPYYGLFNESGLWLRNPGGDGVEDVEQIKEAGFSWLALNVGDNNPSDWEIVRQKAKLHHVRIFPWARIWNDTAITNLVATAKEWNSQTIGFNLEQEAKEGMFPRRCADFLDFLGWTKEVATITEPWLYNGVPQDPFYPHNPNKNGWEPLIELGPVILEIFPQEAEAAKKPLDCIAHAKEIGFKNVFLAYGAYGEAEPNWYNIQNKPYSIYCGDDIGQGNWSKWV